VTFDLEQIWKSKRAFRKRLAQMPTSKKFEMLDALRQRALAIRAASGAPRAPATREEPPPYRAKPK
jgi:hypothetical protein